MPNIVIHNLFSTTINAPAHLTVFDAIQQQGIDWMHACGAKGRCTTCRFEVLQGNENITVETKEELKYREEGKLLHNERLACQCKATGNITLRIPNACKMPHINYSE